MMRFTFLRVLSVVLALGSGLGFVAAAGAQSCTLPDEMKARLREKPNAAVLNDLGVWFANHEQFACAANAFGSSLQTDAAQPDLPHIVFEFGVSLYLSGDTKEAIPSLEEAERLGYRDARLQMTLATALDENRELSAAEAEWRKALAFDPENSAVLDALSSDLIADDDFKGIIELLDQPRLAAWRSAQQAMNLGTAYAKTGKIEDAARILQDGLNTNPDSLELAQQLADILTRTGQKDGAAKVVELAEARRRQNGPQAGK